VIAPDGCELCVALFLLYGTIVYQGVKSISCTRFGCASSDDLLGGRQPTTGIYRSTRPVMGHQDSRVSEIHEYRKGGRNDSPGRMAEVVRNHAVFYCYSSSCLNMLGR
jgi:hypothetical protein